VEPGVRSLRRHGGAITLAPVDRREISKELVQQIVADLRARYAFDDDDVRALGAKLAEPAPDERRTSNLAFAERFVADHKATFNRLGQ
jgi:hypothetical protein